MRLRGICGDKVGKVWQEIVEGSIQHEEVTSVAIRGAHQMHRHGTFVKAYYLQGMRDMSGKHLTAVLGS